MSGDRLPTIREPWSAEWEARLAQFERLWRSGTPTLDELAAQAADCASGEVRRALLNELLKIDIEYRWRKTNGRLGDPSDQPATVENYLKLFPDLAGDDRFTADLAVEEYRVRHRWGDALPREEYAVRFPAGGEELLLRLIEIDKDLLRDDLPAWFMATQEEVSPETMHAGHEEIATRGSPPNKFVEFLWRVKPFSELPEAIVSALAAEMIEREYAAGEVLVSQGGTSKALVVLTEGEVEVSIVDGEQRRRTIDRAGRGAVLGEMALVSNQPHSADVTALTQVRALVLPVENLHRIARQFPPLGAGFADLAAARLGRREVDALYDKSVGGFRIKRRLGQGAMAIVYEAEEESTGRRVALKMMRPQLAYDHVAVKRFHHEAKTMSGLKHANILQVFGCFSAHNTSFIVMELCEGLTLARLIERCAPLTEEQAWPILGQLAAALAFAHAGGVLHRDLKPGNVLLAWDGTLKLSDFGLARSFLSNGLTVRGEILGTPRYMPPEQLIGTHVDERADVYALGCIGYELLMGRPLFQEPEVARLLALQLNWSLDQALEPARCKDPAAFRMPGPPMRAFLAESLATDRAVRTLDLAKTALLAGAIDHELLWVGGMRR